MELRPTNTHLLTHSPTKKRATTETEETKKAHRWCHYPYNKLYSITFSVCIV